MFGILFSAKNLSNYFKKEQFMLKIGGISTTGNESVAYKIYSLFMMYVVLFPYPFVASGDLFNPDFDVFAEAFVYGVGSMLVLLTAVGYFNRLKLGSFLTKLEQEPFLANAERGENDEKTLIDGWISFKEKQSSAFYVIFVLAYFYPVISTALKRYRSYDHHDWTLGFGTITVLNASYSPNYEIVWMYQNIAFFYISFNSCSVVLILAAVLAYISVQFQVLQNNLKRMVLNSYKDMLKDTETSGCSSSTITEFEASTIVWKYLKISLEEAVLYHLDVIDIAEDLNGIFSYTILSIYLYSLGLVCFEVYRAAMLPIVDVRMLRLLLEAAYIVFLSFLICFNGQKMTNESLNVAKAAYEANYAGIDLRFQTGLIMIINRSQKPLIIKAGNFIETSLVTFVWIIRSAYSTCMVLRNLHNE